MPLMNLANAKGYSKNWKQAYDDRDLLFHKYKDDSIL